MGSAEPFIAGMKEPGHTKILIKILDIARSFHIPPLFYDELASFTSEDLTNPDEDDFEVLRRPPFPAIRIVCDPHAEDDGWRTVSASAPHLGASNTAPLRIRHIDTALFAGRAAVKQYGERLTETPESMAAYRGTITVAIPESKEEWKRFQPDGSWIVFSRFAVAPCQEHPGGAIVRCGGSWHRDSDGSYFITYFGDNIVERCLVDDAFRRLLGFNFMLNTRRIEKVVISGPRNRAERKQAEREGRTENTKYMIRLTGEHKVYVSKGDPLPRRKPRPHEVRGHVRRYKSGKVRWIETFEKGRGNAEKRDYDAWGLSKLTNP